MTLEQIYEFPNEQIPLIVVDTRVSVFSLLWRALGNRGIWFESDFVYLWQALLNNPLPEFSKEKFQLVMVDDTKYKTTKNYWRDKYLKEAEGDFPTYKGNRKPQDRPDEYYQLHRAAYTYAESRNIPILAQKGFEADDFAGAICKYAKENETTRPIILFTVDSDWGQLIDDARNILFYYSAARCWKDRLRNEDIIKQWFDERQGILLDDVRDIVKVKAELGDKSDNLIPGSPEAVIDLMNPARTISKKNQRLIARIIKNPCVHNDYRDHIKANNYLNKLIIQANV